VLSCPISHRTPPQDPQVRFNKYLEGKRYLVGDALTYADLALYNVLTVTVAIDPDAYLAKQFPHIRAHLDTVAAHPAIAAYNASPACRPPFQLWTM
jgi:glutathione S-transferase